MKTVRRLLYRDIAAAVAFVSMAFLALFYFIDFVDQLDDVGKTYTTLMAARDCLLELPGHFYELFPICVLIGTIYAMTRMAASSEFTILRTGGLSPGRALALLGAIGLVFALITFAIGDYVSPYTERLSVKMRALQLGGLSLGRTGAWLKDRRTVDGMERNYSVNVGRASPDGDLLDIRIFEFDSDGRLLSRTSAKRGRVGADNAWNLQQVTVTHWPAEGAGTPQGTAPSVKEDVLPEYVWHGGLSAAVVSAAVLPVSTMSTVDLYRYTTHLSENDQSVQGHEIQFWKKALYPFACLVMVALSLPFAYLRTRSGSISLKVFGGIMLGIAFVLLNNLTGHLGLLRNWTPWVAAALPSIVFLLLSLAAFSWLVRYR